MFPVKYLKQAIFMGDLYSLCLYCNLPLSREQLDDHLKTPEHVHHASKKEVHNHIINIQKYNIWFCQKCNVVLTSKEKVTAHTLSNEHSTKWAGCPLITTTTVKVNSIHDMVRIADLFLISEKQYNGADGRYCKICCSLFDSDDRHDCNNVRHLRNMIGSKIQTVGGINFYRYFETRQEVNCLVCNMYFQKSEVDIADEMHWITPGHCNKIQAISKKLTQRSPHLNANVAVHIYYDLEGNANTKDMLKTQELRARNTGEYESMAELRRFGGKYGIIIHESGDRTTAYCKLCKTDILDVGNLKEHIVKWTHFTKLKEHDRERAYSSMVPLMRYLDQLTFNNISLNVVVNDTLEFDLKIFNFCKMIEQHFFYCFLCGVFENVQNVKEHCLTLQHRGKLFCSKVVTVYKEDFIREHNGIFQCPFCNFYFHNWVDIKKHILSDIHKTRRQQHLDQQPALVKADKYTLPGDMLSMFAAIST